MSNEDVVELGIDECWAMLRTPDCAGPTFRIVDEVHITLVNYGVDQPLLFRTSEGTKLLGGDGHAVGLRGRRGHRRLRPQRRREWDGTSVAG